MSIIKIKKHEKYTTVDNTLVNDRSLDWDELGLMLYLLSKPNNWNVSIKHLAKQKKAGETKIKRMLKTLQASGYATWSRDKTGKTAWTIYENPHEANPHVENQPDIIKNQPLIKTDVKQLQGGVIFRKINIAKFEPAIDANIAKQWITYRAGMEKPITSQKTFDQQMNKAITTSEQIISELEITPNDVITESIDAGWVGIGAPAWFLHLSFL